MPANRHVAFCRDNDCEFCQHLAEEHADRINEARAEDEMRAMEMRYEDERDGWFR